MRLYILAGTVAVLIALIIIVALQPDEFRVSRKISIAAKASEVFPHVNDFHNWDAWSPWAKLDPAMKQSFRGADSGAGAIYSWSGNDKVGEGEMSIISSQPTNRIEIKLDFVRPFPCNNMVEFTFEPEGNQTNVTWNMTGKNNFMAKAFSLLINMDKMVGGDFEKGLSQLKTTVEASPGS